MNDLRLPKTLANKLPVTKIGVEAQSLLSAAFSRRESARQANIGIAVCRTVYWAILDCVSSPIATLIDLRKSIKFIAIAISIEGPDENNHLRSSSSTSQIVNALTEVHPLCKRGIDLCYRIPVKLPKQITKIYSQSQIISFRFFHNFRLVVNIALPFKTAKNTQTCEIQFQFVL